MILGLLFLQLVFTVPDSTGRMFTIDFEDMSGLHILDEDTQFTASCPFGEPPLVMLAYSEDGKPLDIEPMVEVTMLLRIDKGRIREIDAVTVPDGGNVAVIARESAAIWDELKGSKNVVVEIERDGETYASQGFSVLGNFEGDSVAVQMMPCS